MLPKASRLLASNYLSDNQPRINSAGRPSVCRSCGAIVGSGQSNCAVCGAPLASGATATRAPGLAVDHETLRFARAVLSRPYIFTIVFLIANFFVFLVMWQLSRMSFDALMGFPEPVLIAAGAKLNSYIDQQHQWWRFVTPLFIHVNLPHLLVNMYSLWMVGPYVEKLYGSAKFVFFWIATGVAGVVASYLSVRPHAGIGPLAPFIFKTADHPSAGASGALFGLVGVLFVFGIRFRHELPEGFKRAFGTGLLPMIALNLFIGFVGRGFIDNAAHLGGFVAGAALALAVDYRRPGERTGLALVWRVLQVLSLALVVISFVKVAQHLEDPMASVPVIEAAQPETKQSNQVFLVFAKAISDAQEAFQVAAKGDVSGIDEAVQGLEAATPPDLKADQLRRQLETLLRRAKELAVAADPRADPKLSSKARDQLAADFRAWKEQYEAWLKTSGRGAQN